MSIGISDVALSKCPLFRHMNETERREIAGLLEHKKYSDSENILSEGDSTQFIWIVLSGRCQVYKNGKSGSEKEFSVLEPNGVFGEMSFFNPAPHSASVRALAAVEVVRLPREQYDGLLRAGSLAAYKLAFNTMGVLIERLRKMDDWAAERLEKNNATEHHEEWMDFQSKLYTGWQF